MIVKPHQYLFLTLLFIPIITRCNALSTPDGEKLERFHNAKAQVTLTPFLPMTENIDENSADPGEENYLKTVWLEDSIPSTLRIQIFPSDTTQIVDNKIEADFIFGMIGDSVASTNWVFAVVAPFPSVIDNISQKDLVNLWTEKQKSIERYSSILINNSTYEILSRLLGKSGSNSVKIVDEEKILNMTWENQYTLAVLPFEDIQPRWKVIRIDGKSPLDKDFDQDQYPLIARFSLYDPGDNGLGDQYIDATNVLSIPRTNREDNKLSVLVMTGVTALVRSTAEKMETKGLTYPAEDILQWFDTADLIHVSNEVSFDPNCPHPNPYQKTLQFCSKPEYIQLLEYIGANIIELSGNHLMDWNRSAYEYSLGLYDERNMHYFAGGLNMEAASKPLMIEHNSNRLAFLGCNAFGPVHAWATETSPGAADCDFERIREDIEVLVNDGYLPIFTFQYHESYTAIPNPGQIKAFQNVADAGAVIVSGSQAHYPQGMEFYKNTFIHYGLGNLFFDQMDIPVHGTRREFIDRHYFYDGRYINTELLTALLEDYAKPRPMTDEERKMLLNDIFEVSMWKFPLGDNNE